MWGRMVHDEGTTRGETMKTTLPGASSDGTVVKATNQNRRNTPSERDSEIRTTTVKNGHL